jgi:hypothetical protein
MESDMTTPSAFGVRRAACVVLLSLAAAASATAASFPLTSPDGNVRATITQEADGGFTYRVDYKGIPVILPSRLGMVLSDDTDLSQGFEPVRPECIFQDDTNRLCAAGQCGDTSLVWHPPFGERAVVTNLFRQVMFYLEKTAPKSHMLLIFRAYDAGVAFQYNVGKDPPRHRPSVINELTEFAFTGDHRPKRSQP